MVLNAAKTSRAGFLAALLTVGALGLISCAHVEEPRSAGSGGPGPAGVSLARDWALDLSQGNVSVPLTWANADRRYLKLTGGTMTGDILFSGASTIRLNQASTIWLARDVSTGVLAGIYANVSPSLNFVSQGVTSTLAGGSWSINGGYTAGVNGGIAFSAGGTGWYDWLGVATGSLPTCNAGMNGVLHWDTTRNEHVRCDSTSWRPYKSSASTELLGVVDSDELAWGSPDTSITLVAGTPGITIERMSARMASGVGAGNINMSCSANAGADVCSCAVSCTASGDTTWTCAGAAGTGCTFTGASTLVFCAKSSNCPTTNPSSKDISIWGTRP